MTNVYYYVCGFSAIQVVDSSLNFKSDSLPYYSYHVCRITFVLYVFRPTYFCHLVNGIIIGDSDGSNCNYSDVGFTSAEKRQRMPLVCVFSTHKAYTILLKPTKKCE